MYNIIINQITCTKNNKSFKNFKFEKIINKLKF